MVDVIKAIVCARVVQQFNRAAIIAAAIVLLALASAHAAPPFDENPIRCGGTDDQPGMLGRKDLDVGGQPDLLVTGTCLADQSLYMFRQVNIVNNGKLKFIEPAQEATDKTTGLPITGQDFWATAIIIEKGGAILAGVDDQKPYGTNKKTLTFHLWGADPRKVNKLKPTDPEGPGVSCVPIPDQTKVEPKDQVADCGIPKTVWDTDGSAKKPMPGEHFPGQEDDNFYQYTSLHGDKGDDPVTKQKGHFGYKVLALSYGGTLRLHGAKGATTTAAEIETLLKSPDATSQADAMSQADEKVLTDSGASWRRLAGGGAEKSADLTLDRSVADNWKDGDEVVVTTTDFFPNHSELRQIKGDSSGTKVTLSAGLTYPHADKVYDIRTKVGAKDESDQPKAGEVKESAFRTAIAARDGNEKFLQTAETRAAVALLTRSIRIVSEGDNPGDTFKDATDGRAADTVTKRPAVEADAHYQYGGQVIFRQGFKQLQIQGVEFKQLGQGGFLGRYPVHFHIARRVPSDTYVIDSSVNESMTRWFVIHSTLGVTLARNVGYKSIGHGYFLEDATEIDNKLYSNLGVYARAPVLDSTDNPRQISGLLDARNRLDALPLKYHSDSQYPSVFWITNGWNSFVGNMAAGAGTCGACYWVVPAGNHDMKDTSPPNTMKPMAWEGYAAIQAASTAQGGSMSNDRAGLSPVRLFYKNYCSTAEHSISITDGSTCTQVQVGNVKVVENPRAPDAPDKEANELVASQMYYPRYTGNRKTAFCNPASPDDADDSCRMVVCNFPDPQHCAPTVLSYYTTAFHWAQNNFSAIWMRTGYLAVDHVFMSDIQGPGVTMVTGGDYTRSNLPVGYWGLVANSIFVGETQARNADNSNWIGGPTSCSNAVNFCVDKASGIAFPLSNWGTGQRMYNVYDGPAYEDAVAYLDIHPTLCNDSSKCIYWNKLGVRRALTELKIPGGDTIPAGQGYLPNAAIGWKQSNGFYYPPAFHSQNLFFNGVDIRHYVVSPITFPGVYRTDAVKAELEFAHNKGNYKIFNPSFSDVDRQTELSDDDGSLTGFKQTVIVNEDPFFRAPVQTSQCRSNVGVDGSNACRDAKPPAPTSPTARTSPYDHLTTALYPAEASSEWAVDCTNGQCTGVPIYRQYLTGTKGADKDTSTREWATWKGKNCDGRFAALRNVARPVANWNPYKTPYDPQGMKPLVPSLGPKINATIEDYLSFEAECPAPFVRMAGMALGLGQRSVLTVNHGLYFIETTRSANYQKTSPEIEEDYRFVSVFRPGQTYYVFFLFAKNEMKQSYQIYGGPSFKETDITGVRMDVTGTPKPKADNWVMPWKVHPVKDDDGKLVPGVMQIDVDFAKKITNVELDPTKLDDKEVKGETCQPQTFCSKTGSTCGCDASKLGILGKLNPKFENVCKNICGHWAVKDLDCPKGGCLGFKFKLANDFVADDKLHRPPPSAYPTAVVDGTRLLRTTTLPDKDPNEGGCYYAKTPNDMPGSTCKVAD